MELTEFLELVVEKNASDGFAAVGSAPILKVNGDLWAAGCGLRIPRTISFWRLSLIHRSGERMAGRRLM